jgi:hypothetical protein
MTNAGGGDVVSIDGVHIPTSMDIQLFAESADFNPLAYLTGWGPSAEDPLYPGDTRSNTSTAMTPSGFLPGDYYICGDVDPGDRIEESNEDNNRACTPFTVIDGPAMKPDLIIESVKSIGVVEASYKVIIKVRNAGGVAAASFPVMAFRRSPRHPVLLTSCPLTESQRTSGGAAPCGGIWAVNPLAPGAVAEWTGYVTFPYAGGFPTNPLPPKPKPEKPHYETVDFMADGCFAPVEPTPLPAWCRVDELDELNNFATKQVIVPR